MNSYDVAVVGGGPAGSAAALCLARAGYAVAIIERSRYGDFRIGETLPPAIKPLLARLGLWQRFLEDSPSSSPAVRSAWGAQALYEQNHLYNPYGEGWHIDRRRLDAMLAREAEDAGAALKEGARMVACDRQACGWAIEFRSEQVHHRLHARFLIDATGRSSGIARRLGARRLLYDNLVGIVGLFTATSESHALDHSTLIEAVENGWWYSAILPDRRLVAAYMTDADIYALGERQSARKWLEQLSLTSHTQARAKMWTLDSEPLIVQANSSRLDQASGESWLAVGDAAAAFDPISGQGVYRAIESGLAAADVVRAFFAGKNEVASYTERLEELFKRYLALGTKYYGQEKRWPRSVFWQRRRAMT